MQPRIESIHSLSPIQKDFLAGFLMDTSRRAYLSQWIGFYSEPIDPDKWKRAWEILVKRHAILRTGFDWENPARPLQIVLRDVAVEIITHEVANTGTLDEFREMVSRIAESRYKEGIDIRRAPLMDFEVVTSPEWSAVIWTRHHLITDGWSLSRLYEEMMTAYAKAVNLPEKYEKQVGYGGYLNTLEPLLNQEESKKYWQDYLETGANVIYKTRDNGGGFVQREAMLSETTMAKLREASKAKRVTLNTLFLTTLVDGLCRTLGLEQVCLGMTETISGVMEEEETIIGPKITTLPVFGTILREGNRSEQLIRVHKRLLSHRCHSLTVINEICKNNPKKIRPYSDIMNTCYVFQNYPLATDHAAPGWPQLIGEIDNSEPGSPILVVVEPQAKAGKLRVASKDKDFDGKTIDRLLTEWQETLAQIVSNESREPMSLGHEVNRAVNEPAIGTEAILERIRTIAEQEESRDAIVTDESAISYGELWKKVQITSQMIKEEIGTALGLVMVESTNQAKDIINILAVWNAGRGHLTVDAEIPALEAFRVYRHEEVVARLTASGVVAKRNCQQSVNTPTPKIRQQAGNNKLAYAILTSGSTGKPKLIGISQKNLEAHRKARRQRYRREDRILLTYPLVFDGAITVLVSALEAGSTLVLAPKSHRSDGRLAISIDQILPTIAKQQVSALNMVPSLLKSLLTHGEVSQLTSVRHLVLAAEELTGADWKVIDSVLPKDLEVWNEYGPSETTVCATEYRIPRKIPIQESSVPIGKAIEGAAVEVVDEQGKPVSTGQKGEIWIRGPIVGQGYLGEPERTKAVFHLERGVGEDVNTYRSGDIGYITEYGALVWCGRKDSQIKVNGVRVRTEEVEALLQRVGGTKEVHTLVLEGPDGVRKMSSLVTLAENQPKQQWLRDAEGVLRARQLEHNLRILATIPRLESGKVDGQALRELALAGEKMLPNATAETEGHLTDKTEAGHREQQLKELFREVLNQVEIHAESDLFRSGGSSLTAMTLTALVRKRLGLKMEVIDVFQAPTPRALAALCDEIEAREEDKGTQRPQAKKRNRWAS